MLHGVLSGLACSVTWGIGDFAGGMAAKRAQVFVVVFLTQLLGFLAVAALALLIGEPVPPRADLLWGGAAGSAGAVGVVCLYASLAAGRMGIAAPITGVIAATIPVTYAWIVVGAPSTLGLVGVTLAVAGIALASGAKAERPPARVLLLAILSGLGFAGFLLLMGLSTGAAFFWTLSSARAASTLALLVLVLALRPSWRAEGRWPFLAMLTAAAGDTLGNAFFLLAAQLGRLDVAFVLSSLYPVTTVLLARYILKERLTRAQAWGAALMLGAIPLVAMS